MKLNRENIRLLIFLAVCLLPALIAILRKDALTMDQERTLFALSTGLTVLLGWKSKEQKQAEQEDSVSWYLKQVDKVGGRRLQLLSRASIALAVIGLAGVILTSSGSSTTAFWVFMAMLLIGVFGGLITTDPRARVELKSKDR